MAKSYDDIGGVWRTIGGRRVFIKTGQSLSDAMKESGKFKLSKEQKKLSDEDKQNIKNLEKIIEEDKKTGNTENRMKAIADQQRYDRLYDKYKESRMNEDKIKDILGERPKTGLEREQRGIKEISYIGQDNKVHKMNSYNYPEDRESYHKYLEDKYGTYKEEEIVKKDNSLSYAKLRDDFYDNELLEKSWEHTQSEAKRLGMSVEEYSKMQTREGIKREGLLVPIDPNKPEDEAKRIINTRDKDRETFKKISNFYGYDKMDNDAIRRTLDEAEKKELYHSKNDIEAMRRYLDRTVIEKDTGSAFSKPGKRYEVLEESKSAFGDKIYKVRDEEGNISWEKASKFETRASNNQISDSLKRKAYEKYLKEHPNSKMKFEDFNK